MTTATHSATLPTPPTLSGQVTWKGGLQFDALLDGFTIPLDASVAVGGTGLGPRPKGLVLAALMGCTGMDVAAILTRMRVVPERFELHAETTLRDHDPKVFESIELRYDFIGDDLSTPKILRAIHLSSEKYCSIMAMLRPVTQITRSVYVNGLLVERQAEAEPVAKPA